MLQTLLELALVSVSIEPGMHAIAFRLAEPPFSFVGLSTMASPHAGSVLEAI
jgi:hypothetical protein